MTKDQRVTLELLDEIIAAFNRRDVKAITSYFAPDGVFITARGADPWGRRLVGRAAIGAYLAERFESIPNMRWVDSTSWIAGERAVSEWTVLGRTLDGEEINWTGCDLWKFRAGEIAVKNTYWKYVDKTKTPDDYT